DQVGGGLGAATIVDDDESTLTSECSNDVRAEAPGAAGDQDDLLINTHFPLASRGPARAESDTDPPACAVALCPATTPVAYARRGGGRIDIPPLELPSSGSTGVISAARLGGTPCRGPAYPLLTPC